MAMPVLAYLWVFKTYDINMPILDDYDAVLGWMHQFLYSNALHEKFLLLFQQHFEHRIVFDYLTELLCFLLLHKINFVFLSFVGSAGLFGIVAVVLYAGRKAGLSYFELIPVPFLLLTLSQHELICFAMASLQQYWQLFFDVSSLSVLVRFQTKPGLAAAGLLAVAASFSGGGGLLVFLVGLLCLLFSRRWRALVFWSILAAITCYVFFVALHYQRTPADRISYACARAHPLNSIAFSIRFIGNFAHSSTQAAIFGVIAIIAGSVLAVRSFAKKQQVFIYVLLFVWLSACLVSLDRNVMGPQAALSSRYTIYSLLGLAQIYIMLISTAPSKFFQRVWAFAGIAISIALYSSWVDPALSQLQFWHGAEENMLITNFATPDAAGELQTAIRDGVFYPSVLFRNMPKQIIGKPGYRDAWSVLYFQVYNVRPDLKAAFPLTTAASYASFLQWAATDAAPDPAYSKLKPLQQTYESMLGLLTP